MEKQTFEDKYINKKVQLFVHQTICLLKIASKGLFIRDELVWVGGLAHLGEMIFVPRSYGVFYLSSIKTFVMSLEIDRLIKHIFQ